MNLEDLIQSLYDVAYFSPHKNDSGNIALIYFAVIKFIQGTLLFRSLWSVIWIFFK